MFTTRYEVHSEPRKYSSRKTLSVIMNRFNIVGSSNPILIELFSKCFRGIISVDNQEILINSPVTAHDVIDKYDAKERAFSINIYTNTKTFMYMIQSYYNLVIDMLYARHNEKYRYEIFRCFRTICLDIDTISKQSSYRRFKYIAAHELGYGISTHSDIKDMWIDIKRLTATIRYNGWEYICILDAQDGNWRCMPLSKEFTQEELNMMLFPALVKSVITTTRRKKYHRGK
jgi:hypothetical protein